MSGGEIVIQILGYLASIFIPLAFLPQTIKTIVKKETRGISIISYSIFLMGSIGFLIFASYRKDIPMIICQIIAGIFTIIILVIATINLVKSRRRDSIPENNEGELE